MREMEMLNNDYGKERDMVKKAKLNTKNVSVEIFPKSVNFIVTEDGEMQVFNITKEDLKSVLVSL
jgi:hypothetical protein